MLEKTWRSRFLKYVCEGEFLVNMQCLLHSSGAECNENVSEFTETSWATVRSCFDRWIEVFGPESDVCRQHEEQFRKQLSDIVSMWGYHPKCYCRFTHKTMINRAEKRKYKFWHQIQNLKVMILVTILVVKNPLNNLL